VGNEVGNGRGGPCRVGSGVGNCLDGDLQRVCNGVRKWEVGKGGCRVGNKAEKFLEWEGGGLQGG
jgi:hypothetical protein